MLSLLIIDNNKTKNTHKERTWKKIVAFCKEDSIQDQFSN